MSTAVSKKKVKRKKTAIKSSPDLLDNVLPVDLDVESELNLDSLEQDHFKSMLMPTSSFCKGEGVGVGEWKSQEEPMFPHELHMTLKNQIQGLEEENEELKTKLKQAEDRLAAASPLRNVGRASDLAAGRIVELSKKIKELQSQIKLQNYTLGKKGPPFVEPHKGGGDASLLDADNIECCSECVHVKAEFNELTDKYNSANIKLCELRNQNQHLRHEFKLAVKALQSEIGEKVNVPNILSGGQGWRGRAQQILGLQQKVAELNEKLNQIQTAKSNNSEGCGKNRAEIESLKTEIETLRTESDTVKCELADTKRRLEESKARVKSLQTEFSAIRAANAALSEKIAVDKKLIDSLNAQLGSATEKAKGKESVSNNRYEHQISLLKRDLSQERLKNEQLEETVKEKDCKIASLQAKSCYVPRLSQSMSEEQVPPVESRCVSARSVSLDNSPINTGNGSNEAERARLMELVGVNARRLQEERKNTSMLEEQLRTERHKCARLETKLARLELERVGWSKGLYKKPTTADTISRSDCEWETLKDKSELLEEKCLALESRLRTIHQEKEDDNRRFIQIIEEQRSSFADLQRKQTLS